MSSYFFSKKNILIVSHQYRAFIKDQVEELSSSFNNSYSLVRHNKFAEVSNYFDIPSINGFSKRSIIDLHNKPSNVHVLPTSFYYLPFNWAYKRIGSQHYYAVRKTLKKYNIAFDLVHSHFIWSAGYVGVKLKEQFNVPLIITGHGYDVYSLPFIDESWRNLITTTIDDADHIITVSNKNKEILESLKINTPITVIPNGYKKELFYPMNKNMCRTQLGIPLNKKILLTVGNLVEIKGHKYLIDALKLLKKSRNDFICYIIGEGKLKTALQKQIQDNGLNENIKLIGRKNHQEIPIWMNATDMLVVPSIRESFGVVQIEAMACGKPVIATKNGGSEEIITSRSIGFLVPPKNSIDLKDAILQGLEKDWATKKIVCYSTKFSWEIHVEKILNIYEKYVDKQQIIK